MEDLRNIAIIAHVDHGKTTLVDEMLKQSGIFRENQDVQDRALDSGDLERERGITILAKNTAVSWRGVRINIVDTPGHADFGGEVERVLKMVNGVLLLVDAAEGPMPQTRFVLSRALELGHKVIVVINKVDRPDQRVLEVIDEVLELLLDLNATDEQLDSPMLFCSGRQGTASYSPEVPGETLEPLFNTILEYIPAPERNIDAPFQMLISSVDYNEYVGRIAIGRIERGVVRQNQEIVVCNYHSPNAAPKKAKIVSMYRFDGLNRTPITEAAAGEIIAVSGIPDVTIGDTFCVPDRPEPLSFVKISDPTVEMTFSVNDSPFAGKEGKFVTSRQIRQRLLNETLKDVSLRVTEMENSTDSFLVAGRGEMHLSILIETMRREGYEFQVSPPRVLYKTENGKKMEPVERLVADVPQESVGAVIEKLGSRHGELIDMAPVGSRMRATFLVPSRGLFGYRNEFLTDTRGEGIMASVLDGYVPYKGDIVRRNTGSLVAFETGESVTYGLFNAQERGALFIGAGVPVYAGMVIGVSPKNEDISVNVCKTKHLTNTRAAGSDEALRLVPPRQMSLEQCLEFLGDDELLEVTPQNLRIRKQILDHSKRMRQVMRQRGNRTKKRSRAAELLPLPGIFFLFSFRQGQALPKGSAVAFFGGGSPVSVSVISAAVIFSVAIFPVSITGGGVDPVQHKAQDLGVHQLQLGDRAHHAPALRLSGTHNKQCAIRLGDQNSRVRDQIHRRGIQDDIIVSLSAGLQHLRHSPGSQKLRGIGWDAPGQEYIDPMRFRVVNGTVQQGRVHQHIGQPLGIRQLQQPIHLRQTQITVDQQHPLLRHGIGDRQIQGGQTLPLISQSGGDSDHAASGDLTQRKGHIGPQRLIGLSGIKTAGGAQEQFSFVGQTGRFLMPTGSFFLISHKQRSPCRIFHRLGAKWTGSIPV